MITESMTKRLNSSNLLGYVIALLASLVAALTAQLTVHYFQESPFVLFVFAVVVSAWFGGRGPGLVATIVGALAASLSLSPASPTVIQDFLWFAMSLSVMFLINLLISTRRQAQETLRRLKGIVEYSGDAIIGLDLDGRINSWNAGAEQVYGYSAEQVKDRSVSIFVPPDGAAQVAENLERIRQRERLRFEAQHVRADGLRIEVSYALSPVKDDRGHAIGASMIARDITTMKRAQVEREKLLASEQAARAEAEAAARQLEGVQAITDSALAHLGLDDLLQELLTRVRMLLLGDIATVLLLSEDRKQYVVRASSGVGPLSESVQSVGDAELARIIETNETLVVEDLSAYSGPIHLLQQRSGSLIGVPLRVEGNVIGVIHVGTQWPRHFTADEVRLLQVVADRVALAIDRAHLFDQVRLGAERMKRLSQRLMTAQELERRNIARELHDEIGQALTAVKINLQIASRTFPAPSPTLPIASGRLRAGVSTAASDETEASAGPFDQSLVGESIALVESTLQQVRSLSLDLRPSVLDDLGLVSALRWYLDRSSQRAGFSAEFTADDLTGRPPSEIEIACFRVAQEALTNIARHARAQRVKVRLMQLDHSLEVLISDDGVGFDVSAARERAVKGSSLGLLGMEERVLAVSGNLEIQSQPHDGTQIRARFPFVNIS